MTAAISSGGTLWRLQCSGSDISWLGRGRDSWSTYSPWEGGSCNGVVPLWVDLASVYITSLTLGRRRLILGCGDVMRMGMKRARRSRPAGQRLRVLWLSQLTRVDVDLESAGSVAAAATGDGPPHLRHSPSAPRRSSNARTQSIYSESNTHLTPRHGDHRTRSPQHQGQALRQWLRKPLTYRVGNKYCTS